MSNTSSSVPPYLSAQSWASFGASTSRAVMRRVFAARLTLPSSTYRQPRSRPMAARPRPSPLRRIAEDREITRRARTRDRSVMISSVSPSLKYSVSGSGLRLAKGKTTIDLVSGSPTASPALRRSSLRCSTTRPLSASDVPRRAASTSAAVRKRAAGSLARQRSITRQRAGASPDLEASRPAPARPAGWPTSTPPRCRPGTGGDPSPSRRG